MTPTHRSHDMTIESAPDLPSQLAVKVMHEIGSNNPDLYGRIQETLNAALAAASQPAPDAWRAFSAQSRKLQAVLHIPGVKEALNNLKWEGWEPQPAPADREALLEAVQWANHDWEASEGGDRCEFITDRLLARGLRLPHVSETPETEHEPRDVLSHETMAWAVIGENGKPLPHAWSDRSVAASHAAQMRPVCRVVRVAIRVVEGGDDEQ